MKKERRFHFTKQILDRLCVPTAKRAFYFDDSPRQLCVRVQPSGAAQFVLMKRSGSQTFHKSLGKVGELTIEAARKHAHRLLNETADWKASGFKGEAPLAKPAKRVPVEVVTFGKMFEDHVLVAREKMAEEHKKNPDATERNLRYVYKPHLAHLANKPIKDLTGEGMKTLHEKIATESGKYAANRAMQLCRAVCRLAVKNKLLAADPTQSVTMKAEEARETFLQPAELLRLEKVLKAETDRDAVDFIRLALLTGARKGSLLTMKWSDISFPFSKWKIPDTKAGGAQTIELTPSAVAILEARKRGDSEWVFPNPQSASGHAPDFKREWQRIRKAAGIEDVRLHDLRRTCASYQTIAGVPLSHVGATLGHRSLKSTEVYARLNQSPLRLALLAGEEAQKRSMADAAKKLKAEAKRAARKLKVVPRSA